jgi:pyruvate dehydrogenase E2 component (dihydrolipoamide acetyltransferase)
MASPYADARRLRLEAGNEVEALVRIEPSGQKRPKCLLIHGNPGSIPDWEQVVPLLFGVADVAAIDMPGFGRSRRVDSSPESMSLDRLADHAISAANALDWREPFFLLGHSHGSAVAQTVAVRYPDRIAGLALLGSLGATPHANYRLMSLPGAATIARLAGRMFCSARLRALSRAILRRTMSTIFSPDPVPPEKLERDLALLAESPEILLSMVHVTLGRPCAQLLRRAPEIRCPTLFLHGRDDALVSASRARAIHDRIVNAGGRSQLELVPRAGHMLINYQANQLVEIIHRSLLAPR